MKSFLTHFSPIVRTSKAFRALSLLHRAAGHSDALLRRSGLSPCCIIRCLFQSFDLRISRRVPPLLFLKYVELALALAGT